MRIVRNWINFNRINGHRMAAPETNTIYSPGILKLRKILLILAACLIFIFVGGIYAPIRIHSLIFFVVFLLILIDVIVYFSLSKKYYDWTLFFLFIIVIAIFLKRLRLFWGPFITIGFAGLAAISLLSAVIFLRKYKHNLFLRYIGFSSSLILTLLALGQLWKNMHWPLAGFILNFGLILFIPFLLAFVITLPGSNYLNWNLADRDIFFKAIIIPMIYVYILCALVIVFPEIWTDLTRLYRIPFNMSDFELISRPGLF